MLLEFVHDFLQLVCNSGTKLLIPDCVYCVFLAMDSVQKFLERTKLSLVVLVNHNVIFERDGLLGRVLNDLNDPPWEDLSEQKLGVPVIRVLRSHELHAGLTVLLTAVFHEK